MSVKTTARAKGSRARRAVKEARSWVDHVEGVLPPPLRELMRRAREDETLMLAAGLAFYAAVSVVPLVLLVLAVVSIVIGDRRVEGLADAIGRLAPKDLGAGELVRHVASVATRTSVVAFLTGLWPATSYGSGLVRAFDILSPTRDRSAQGLRGRGLVLVVLLPVFAIGALVGSYAASQVLGSSGLDVAVGIVLALVAGFLGAAIGLVLIYRIFPPEHMGWRAILTATAITAAAITVLSLLLTVYVSLGANFQEHYATSSLGVFILIAVWFFLSNTMLLVGYKIALDRNRKRS